MRNANAAFIAALATAPRDGLDVRRFLYVRAKTRATLPVAVNVGLWNGDDDVSVAVMDGLTGIAQTRTYYGVGSALVIPKIPRVSDLTIQAIEVKISQLNIINQIMVRENNVRFAKVDIHEGIISPASGVLVSPPEIAFLGEVDGDPIDTPEAGGEGSITLEIVSDAIRSLTRINPAKRSDSYQTTRAGDRFSRYSNLTERIKVAWGETT
jgi:hypothetical protein